MMNKFGVCEGGVAYIESQNSRRSASLLAIKRSKKRGRLTKPPGTPSAVSGVYSMAKLLSSRC
jgi:hypothetical protein